MTYSLHKQTQVQTAAQQTLLKHFLLQVPLAVLAARLIGIPSSERHLVRLKIQIYN